MPNTQVLSNNWEPKEDKLIKLKEHKLWRVLNNTSPIIKKPLELILTPEETLSLLDKSMYQLNPNLHSLWESEVVINLIPKSSES